MFLVIIQKLIIGGKDWKNQNIEKYLLNYVFNNKKINFEKLDITKIIKLNSEKINFFSKERFSSSYYFDNLELDQGLKRLVEVFKLKSDETKIILILLNQTDLIISRYAENNNLIKNKQKIYAGTNVINIQANNFYKKVGFQKTKISTYNYHIHSN